MRGKRRNGIANRRLNTLPRGSGAAWLSEAPNDEATRHRRRRVAFSDARHGMCPRSRPFPPRTNPYRAIREQRVWAYIIQNGVYTCLNESVGHMTDAEALCPEATAPASTSRLARQQVSSPTRARRRQENTQEPSSHNHDDTLVKRRLPN